MIALASMSVNLEATTKECQHWQNSLKPKGKAAAALSLAVNGRTDWVIIIPAKATAQEQKAAEELGHWLVKMTGATFPIVTDDEEPRQKEISVGRTSRLKAAALPVAEQDLGDEGYAIAIDSGRLLLLGGHKRGPINAVYALLEEDLGCRWYTAKASRVPKSPTLTFSPVPRSYVPRLKIRDPFYKVAFDGTWSLRNRTNAPLATIPEKWGGNINYADFCHTVHKLVPPGRYFKNHPEYFMMDGNGNRQTQQLCMTNPDVIKIAIESVLRILKNQPHTELISVSKMDGGNSCGCPTCKKIDEAEGTNMGSLLYFVNKVAEEVEKDHPDVTVTTLAYLETVGVPRTLRPRRNVAIRLCTDSCMWSHPFTPAEENRRFRDTLTSWARVHDRLHIWDYCVNFSHYTAPMPNMDVIAANIRFFVKNNAEGVMEQGAFQCPGAERDLMRAWVIAKVMWDPSLDLSELMQDFIWGYFGKAAPAIADYNELMRANAEEHRESLAAGSGGCRFPMDSPFLSRKFLERATICFDRAEKLAENEEILHRVERERIPIMYVKLCRGPLFVGDECEYKALADKFEKVARRAGLTHIYEATPPNVEQMIQNWRSVNRIPSPEGRRLLFEDNFAGDSLGEGWTVHIREGSNVSLKVADGALIIEAPADWCANVRRPIPPGTTLAECVVNLGTDRGQSWGVGLGLLWSNGNFLKLNVRADGVVGAVDRGREYFGGASSPNTWYCLRFRFEKDRVFAEMLQDDGQLWRAINSFSREQYPDYPATVLVGKMNHPGKNWDHYGGGFVGKCYVKSLRVFANE